METSAFGFCNTAAPARLAALAACLAWFIVSCGGPVGPSKSELEGRLKLELPAPWELQSLSIEASENLGSKVEPLVKARFSAEVELADDTFQIVRREGVVVFINTSLSRGESRVLHGIATSVQRAGGWHTEFAFENNPFKGSGIQRSAIEQRTVLVGTDEEEAFRAEQAELARKRAEAEEAAISERNRAIVAALASGRTLSGTQVSGRINYSFRIRFVSVDQKSGEVRAENRWMDSKTGEFKQPNTVEGVLTRDRLALTERVTSGERGGRQFTLQYVLALDSSGKQLVGTWNRAGRRAGSGGRISIDL